MDHDDPNELPPGWWMSERGPVTPHGRVYDFIPQGYELADMAIFDAILDEMLASVAKEHTAA